jgi:hypothetical protein
MTEYSTITKIEGRDVTASTNRRRITDRAQPLDYVTKELVSDFIESQPRTAQPLKSFIQKMLKVE